MDKNEFKDADLENLFEVARRAPPKVPEALTARVLADADSAQAAKPVSALRTWFANLGGLPGLGGLVTATCVGFWLGVAPPQGLPDLAGNVLGFEEVASDEFENTGITGFGWDIEEG